MDDEDVTRADPELPAPSRLPRRSRGWILSLALATAALAALIGGSAFGDVHGVALRPRVFAWGASGLFVGFGVLETRRLARSLDRSISVRTIPAAGAGVRLVASGVGYLVVVFGVFGILDVSIAHLLVGAGLAGVVLGIAAQQSLGNAFAAVVLLLARPFTVGDRIRVRSGALGGIFEATVLDISLTYVTVRTPDGILKLPNSTLLAAGVGVLTPDEEHPAPLTLRAIRERDGSAKSHERRSGKRVTRAPGGVRRRSSSAKITKIATHSGRVAKTL